MGFLSRAKSLLTRTKQVPALAFSDNWFQSGQFLPAKATSPVIEACIGAYGQTVR